MDVRTIIAIFIIFILIALVYARIKGDERYWTYGQGRRKKESEYFKRGRIVKPIYDYKEISYQRKYRDWERRDGDSRRSDLGERHKDGRGDP